MISVLPGSGLQSISSRAQLPSFLLMILMTLPVQVTLVPDFIMLGYMNLLNTYAALILPSIIVPLGTFILTQSFKSVPNTVLDARHAGRLRRAAHVVLRRLADEQKRPCVRLLLSFLDAWNMVEQPIAFLKEAEQYPISVALAYTPPSGTSVQLVCCILVVLPALFLFTFFNRELVEGIVLAEVK